MKLQLIRNATIKLYYGGYCLLLDPYLGKKGSGPSYAGKKNSPTTDLPLKEQEILKGVDAVVLSHLHSDHFDDRAERLLDKNIPVICQTDDVDSLIKKGFKKTLGIQSCAYWNDIKIHRINGQHGSGDVLYEMGITSGFIFEKKDNPSIYWTGDTILSDSVREAITAYKPEIIVTHSCGAQWKGAPILMDDRDTVEIAGMTDDSRVVAVHMDAVDHATVTREQLKKTADRLNVESHRIIIPEDGETIEF